MHTQVLVFEHESVFACHLLTPPTVSQSVVFLSNVVFSVCSSASLRASVWTTASQTHYITTTVKPDTQTQGALSQTTVGDT